MLATLAPGQRSDDAVCKRLICKRAAFLTNAHHATAGQYQECNWCDGMHSLLSWFVLPAWCGGSTPLRCWQLPSYCWGRLAGRLLCLSRGQLLCARSYSVSAMRPCHCSSKRRNELVRYMCQGTYEDRLGSSGCQACPSGYYCPAGSAAPIPAACNPGTYISNVTLDFTQADCKPCPMGLSCAGGQSQPTPCLPGTMAPSNKSAQCAKCAAGSFQGGEGQTECLPCPKGYFCIQGSATGVPCPGGTYSNQTALSSREQCLPCQQTLGHRWAARCPAMPALRLLLSGRCRGHTVRWIQANHYSHRWLRQCGTNACGHKRRIP